MEVHNLHFPALTSFAFRCWLRVRRRNLDLTPSYEPLGRCVQDYAIASAQGALIADDVFAENPYEAHYVEAEEALLQSNPGFRLTKRHRAWREGELDQWTDKIFELWNEAQPNTSPLLVALIRGADSLHYAAKGELAMWRIAWKTGHFDDFVFYQAHRPAVEYAREVRSLTLAVLPDEESAIRRDLDLLLRISPPLVVKEHEMPTTEGYLDPSENGPLGPL